MRRGQRHNAITNSPIVRSFIRPVLSTVPTPSATTTTSAAQQDTLNKYLGEVAQPDEQWLIPTQPSLVAAGPAVVEEEGGEAGSSDVKGKKRARVEEHVGEEQLVEYDAAAGTRFGVAVRYSEDNLPLKLDKYWAQRYRLFSLFDDGCEMDREGWYSVTPENVAAQIAERCRSGTIVDAFCGVGGNAIQFAFTCERVIALDTSPVGLACAAHNARVYGVADRITFILGDWVAWAQAYADRLERGEEMSDEDRVECVFLSPPWGGIDYQTTLSTTAGPVQPATKKRRRQSGADNGEEEATPARGGAYPLSALAPLHGADLFALARRVTPNVAMFLPRNVDLLELATLPGLGEEEKVEVEEAWMGWKCKAVTAYFGELAIGNGYVEGGEEEER
ncbi:hypothetical protein JCM8208_007634 [Rhodotorula glutinis]